jgi:pimeloyl-ACP methyl ester carboxylesterase
LQNLLAKARRRGDRAQARALRQRMVSLPSTWRLPFHPQDMYRSEDLVHGDHWEDWKATDCPALLIHGTKGIIPAEQIRAMVEHRPGTAPVELDADHLIPTTAPDAFTAAVKAFLATI